MVDGETYFFYKGIKKRESKLEIWRQTLEFQDLRLSPKHSIGSANLINKEPVIIML